MGNFRVVLGLGLGLLLGSACQGDGDGSRGSFVEYWSDGDTWCEHQSCGDLQQKKACELAWPTIEDTEEALELAELSAAQLSKCRASSEAYDDCFLEMSCEDLASIMGVFCPDEHQRFQLDCASVLDAFTILDEMSCTQFDENGECLF